MGDFGIKISKPGHSVLDLDENGENQYLSFSSKYDHLKIARTGSGTFSTGSSATIAHSLGYPAAFIVYTSTDNVNFTAYGGRSYIDSTNLVITKDRDQTISTFYHDSNYDTGFRAQGLTYAVGYGAWVGRNEWGGGDRIFDGALRFTNINITGSVTKAEIGYKISSTRNGTVQVRTKGIAEDNTSDFGGDPFGRPQTSNTVTNSCDNGINDVWAYEVTSLFNEITGRAGWSSGNAMGFLLFDNGTPYGSHIMSSLDYQGTYLRVTNTAPVQTIYYRYVIFSHKLDATKALV